MGYVWSVYRMKRKLVKQGAATLMISLPSKWIHANKLGKGDEVEVEEKGNDLNISPKRLDKIKETQINLLSNIDSSIRTILTNTYRQGYDKVTVNFKDAKSIESIEKVVATQLLGFEIIKKTHNSCIIENVTEPSKEQFENIFSKMIMNIEELISMTGRALSGEKFEGFEKTEAKIKEFDNFCRRLISRETMEREDIKLAFHQELIHAQRNLYYLLAYLAHNKIKSTKTELDFLGTCREMFSLLMDFYKNKKTETLEKMHSLETESYKKGYNLLSKKDVNSIVIYNILSATRGFYLASSPLTVLAF